MKTKKKSTDRRDRESKAEREWKICAGMLRHAKSREQWVRAVTEFERLESDKR